MLDYSTIQVVNPNIGLASWSMLYISISLFVGIALFFHFRSTGDSRLSAFCWSIATVLVLVVYLVCTRGIKSLALVKIEATGIEMKSEAFPSENEYPCFKKEGKKIYYYTKVWQEDIKSPSKVRDRTFKKFKEVKFDLENQIKE